MKVQMYAVYDAKLEAYMMPLFMQNKGAALRAWETTVNDPSTQFSKYAADFTLFQIGEYDDSTGIVSALPAKISLGTALEFRKAPNEAAPITHLNAGVN